MGGTQPICGRPWHGVCQEDRRLGAQELLDKDAVRTVAHPRLAKSGIRDNRILMNQGESEVASLKWLLVNKIMLKLD